MRALDWRLLLAATYTMVTVPDCTAFHGYALERLAPTINWASSACHARVLKESNIDEHSRDPLHIEAATFGGSGCVLLAKPEEYDHFLRRAAVFLYHHSQKGSKGAILERQTPFSVTEMSPIGDVFASNALFVGGESGPNTAIMLHPHGDIKGAMYVGGGIYIGGLEDAINRIRSGEMSPKTFKFFFNYVSWAPGELSKQIEMRQWDVAYIPTRLVLRQTNQESDSLWFQARNFLKL